MHEISCSAEIAEKESQINLFQKRLRNTRIFSSKLETDSILKKRISNYFPDGLCFFDRYGQMIYFVIDDTKLWKKVKQRWPIPQFPLWF